MQPSHYSAQSSERRPPTSSAQRFALTSVGSMRTVVCANLGVLAGLFGVRWRLQQLCETLQAGT